MNEPSAAASLSGVHAISTFLNARHICLTDSTRVERSLGEYLVFCSLMILPVSRSKIRLVIPCKNAGIDPFFLKVRKSVESMYPAARLLSKSLQNWGKVIVRNDNP
jgi:hypothetical protein